MDGNSLGLSDLVMQSHEFTRPFRVTKGKDFRLASYATDDTLNLESKDKPAAKEMLRFGVRNLSALQERLYADDHWSILLIFQAMDAAGKDGAIKHVMSGVNPQGCQVYSFKQPSGEELDHGYLWRCTKRLPERGRIGIFNRSYYEETLVVRVHPQLMAKQRIPAKLVTDDLWQNRFQEIRDFERYLSRNGVVVRKFFLNVSKKEQKKRFLSRLDEPEKHWKFSAADVEERGFWDDYMKAYEEMIQQTATEEAPWYVIPADHKWFTRLAVAAVVVETLAELNLDYPQLSEEQRKALKEARKVLEAEKD